MRTTLYRLFAALMLAAVVFGGAASLQALDRDVKEKVAPAYPELAKRMNVFGTVKVMVTIAPSGSVTATKVVGGHPLLADAAVSAIKKWKYEPAAAETSQLVEVNFNKSF